MRLLACGGDGTAGWVLSVLDSAGLPDNPPVGVLPLGEDNYGFNFQSSTSMFFSRHR